MRAPALSMAALLDGAEPGRRAVAGEPLKIVASDATAQSEVAAQQRPVACLALFLLLPAGQPIPARQGFEAPGLPATGR